MHVDRTEEFFDIVNKLKAGKKTSGGNTSNNIIEEDLLFENGEEEHETQQSVESAMLYQYRNERGCSCSSWPVPGGSHCGLLPWVHGGHSEEGH